MESTWDASHDDRGVKSFPPKGALTMHALDLHHPSWYRALTLTERLASLREDRQAARDVAVDAGRAERRLRRWRDQEPVLDGRLLRPTPRGRRDERGRPAAAARRADRGRPGPIPGSPGLARSNWTGPSPGPIPHRPPRPEEASGNPLADFLEIVQPLISQGRDRLREGIEVLGREHGRAAVRSPDGRVRRSTKTSPSA